MSWVGSRSQEARPQICGDCRSERALEVWDRDARLNDGRLVMLCLRRRFNDGKLRRQIGAFLKGLRSTQERGFSCIRD
jgi:hypothetical protein